MDLTLDQALQKGVEAHKAGKVQEADRYYTAILKSNPKHPDANHNMGVLAVGVGKVDQALPFFKTALEANPKIAQFWLSYVDALIKLNRMDDAKSIFDKAKSHGAKGDGFDKLEQKFEDVNGSGTFKKNLELNQSNILDDLTLTQVLNLAKKKDKEGFSDEAKRLYQNILQKFPKNKKALDGIKGIHNKPTFKNSNRKDSVHKKLQFIIDLYDQGQLQKVINTASELLVKAPGSGSFVLYNIIGAANKGLGNLDDAIEAYKKAIVIKPDFVEAYNNMGVVYKKQGKLEEALELYYKAININPDYSTSYNNIGNILQEQGKLDEALEAYNKAIDITPDDALAYNNIGACLKGQGKLDEALVAYSKSISIKPDYAEAHNNMGYTLKLQGRVEDAIMAYKKALSINPDNGIAKHMIFSILGETSKTAPREYVESLFDSYAGDFEEVLEVKLEYKVPKLITRQLLKMKNGKLFGSVLDLGCGTGLLGSEMKGYFSNLVGIDLSSKMLEIAKQKQIYSELIQTDIIDYLSNSKLNFDYFICLDVFIYVGELSDVFRSIQSRNIKSGKLAFSTEHTEKKGYHLLESGRYSHSKSYIESLCKEFGYEVAHFSNIDLRREKGSVINGGLYILDF